MHMAWLALGGMLCSLELSTGSFPRPLSPKEEHRCLERAAAGDPEARNTLIERNLITEEVVSHKEKYICLTTTGFEGYTRFICKAADKTKELETIMSETHVA